MLTVMVDQTKGDNSCSVENIYRGVHNMPWHCGGLSPSREFHTNVSPLVPELKIHGPVGHHITRDASEC
jgi:hypothetical protein